MNTSTHDRTNGTVPRRMMTMERAADFEMPIGKFKGMTIAQIDEAGQRDYLRWGVEVWTGSIGRAVTFYLANVDASS